MPLGWIDFSKSERSKILSILDALSEDATLDELGIAPIRDGFANLFFPGTSTIQTRAKYFFIVPYAMRDLECSNELQPGRMLKTLTEIEKQCALRLLDKNENEEGVIGKRSLPDRWVKRAPSDIYWAGLRRYNIFLGGSMSLSEYIRSMCIQKAQKQELTNLGNRNDNSEDDEKDDVQAGDVRGFRFWNMPLYNRTWSETLDMNLTSDEKDFLKKQILLTCPDSMLGCILKNDMQEVLELNDFKDLQDIIRLFPDRIQEDYDLALRFSGFVYALRVIYNILISDGESQHANAELVRLLPDLPGIAGIDMDRIFVRLGVHNPKLHRFLDEARKQMISQDTDKLKELIRNREKDLKGQARAKTCHPGQYENRWYGGEGLDYRFGNAMRILRDIFAKEVTDSAQPE